MSQFREGTRVPLETQTLLEALRAQSRLYHRLEEVLQQEKVALIQGNGEQIAAITVDKRQLIREIDELEQHQREQIRRCAAELTLSGEEKPLSALIQHCPSPQAQQLQELHKTLRGQVRTLQYLSQVNAALLHVAIDWLNQSLDTYSHILRTTLGDQHGTPVPAFVNIRI